ncbi:MAG: Fur family transcriptional regulator [Rhodospirillales bacterium]
MDRPYSQIIEKLRAAGLRPTRQRLALAKLLFEGGGCHVTAEILHSEARSADIRVSLATVYNTLHQFTAAGLLREIVVDASRSYFDTTIHDHHHFFFEDSGRLEDIPEDQLAITGLPMAPPGTSIKSVNVVVRLTGKAA